MQVKLDMDDVTTNLGNKGIVLDISDNAGKHVGHLRIGQATVEWRPGRTRDGYGTKIRLQDLVKWLDEVE